MNLQPYFSKPYNEQELLQNLKQILQNCSQRYAWKKMLEGCLSNA